MHIKWIGSCGESVGVTYAVQRGSKLSTNNYEMDI